MMNLDPKDIDHVLGILGKGLANPEVQAALPLDMKIAILNAADITAEKHSDTILDVNVFFMHFHIDISDENNPTVAITMNMTDLERYNLG